MLRRTHVAFVFMSSQGPAKSCGHPNNDNLEELLFYVKHAKKMRQYLGSHFQRIPDREAQYGAFGGPRGGRFTIKRATSRKQFYHHNATRGRYAIHHTNPTNAWSGVGGGGMYRNIWDNQVTGTNSWWDVTFKMFGKDLSKDKATEWMEDWGVRFKVLDEYSQPKMEDMLYVKHNLYAHNFPWLKDPVTTAYKGDADYQWRGTEKFDYKDHGAGTPSVANEFRSLWGIKPMPQGKANGGAQLEGPAGGGSTGGGMPGGSGGSGSAKTVSKEPAAPKKSNASGKRGAVKKSAAAAKEADTKAKLSKRAERAEAKADAEEVTAHRKQSEESEHEVKADEPLPQMNQPPTNNQKLEPVDPPGHQVGGKPKYDGNKDAPRGGMTGAPDSPSM